MVFLYIYRLIRLLCTENKIKSLYDNIILYKNSILFVLHKLYTTYKNYRDIGSTLPTIL